MLFARVVETSTRVTDSTSRRTKVRLLADLLAEAEPDERAAVVAFVAGRLRQRRTGIGYASLRALPSPATASTLTISDVDEQVELLATLTGPGSARRRAELLATVMARATAGEQRLLAGLLTGELRQGAAVGLLLDAVAVATSVPAAQVRRAVTTGGDPLRVSATLLDDPEAALAASRMAPGRPLSPMLAAAAPTVSQALERTGAAVVEWKLDGIRVQAHRDDEGIQLFSRSLENLTGRLPEVVAALEELPGTTFVLDGEVLALDAGGRPRPFQETSSLTARRTPAAGTGLCLAVFDCLHRDGTDLLDEPLTRRRDELVGLGLPVLGTGQAVGTRLVRVAGTVVDPANEGEEAERRGTAEAIRAAEAGHEGVVVKALGSSYAAGRRGAAWVKVKPRHTLDLLVLAVEPGSGRRQGWLSNLHLGALDSDGEFGPVGGAVMLGKTFKGLSDDMLRWQTQRLRDLAVEQDRWCVRVRPELVVEVAFDGIQDSPRYPAGMALRFARVVAHRPDKPAAEADTISAVRRLHGRPRGAEGDARRTDGPAGPGRGRGRARVREG